VGVRRTALTAAQCGPNPTQPPPRRHAVGRAATRANLTRRFLRVWPLARAPVGSLPRRRARLARVGGVEQRRRRRVASIGTPSAALARSVWLARRHSSSTAASPSTSRTTMVTSPPPPPPPVCSCAHRTRSSTHADDCVQWARRRGVPPLRMRASGAARGTAAVDFFGSRAGRTALHLAASNGQEKV
jgi:hypothetical protein